MKNSLKKTLALFLAVLMVVLCAPLVFVPAFAESGTDGNITWNYDEDTKTLTISGSGDMKNYYIFQTSTADAPPWKAYKNVAETLVIEPGVTGIGEYAFYFFESLTSISLPDGLENIWQYAFTGCSGVESIEIPDSVTSIGNNAFYYCTSLRSVTIPDCVTNIGEYVFAYCPFESLSIPDGITSIGLGAFTDCTGLKSVVIPASVTSIGDRAFETCGALKTVNFTGSEPQWNAVSMGEYVFGLWEPSTGERERTEEEKLDFCFNYHEDGNLFWHYNDTTKTLTVGGSGDIKDYAASVNPPWNAYKDSAETVVIEPGVTSVGARAFKGFTALQNVSLPNGLTSVGQNAFSGCTALISLTIPEGVTSMGTSAFWGCAALQSVSIPAGVTWFSGAMFCNCTSLLSVTIPEGVMLIAGSCFFGCEALQNITIPASVTEICTGALNNCPALKTIFFTGSEAQWNNVTKSNNYLYIVDPDTGEQRERTPEEMPEIIFNCNVDGNIVWYYDETAKTLYIGGSGDMKDYDTFDPNDLPPWYGKNLSSIVIGSGVTGIGNGAFYHFGGNPNVSLPEGLTKIGYRAFYFCEELQNIVLPESLTEIGEQAFYGCYKLESMTIPENVQRIGASTFCGCYNLVSFTIPEHVKSIGVSAFSECKALQTVTIHDGITEIGESAFLNCPKLKTVNFTGSEAQWNAINKGGHIFDYYDYETFEYYDRPAEEMPVFNFYYGVEGTINAIDDIGTVEYTAACKARINAARAAYDRLSDYETTLVTNHETLVNAENTYKALEVEALIAAIGDVEYTDESKAKIDAARAAYDALTADQQALVTNVTALTDAETAYAKTAAKEELAAYKNADDYRADEQAALAAAISAGNDAIDAAADTDAVDAALAGAKTAIDAIKTDAELTAEEEAAAAAADQAAADAVEAKIDAIGEVAFTDESKAKIDEARAAYDALTPAQQALVENADVLTAAEARYDELKAEAETPEEPTHSKECPLCGKVHNHGLFDVLLGELHWWIYTVRRIITSFAKSFTNDSIC